MEKLIKKWLEHRFLRCHILDARTLECVLNRFGEGFATFKVDYKNPTTYLVHLYDDDNEVINFDFQLENYIITSIKAVPIG